MYDAIKRLDEKRESDKFWCEQYTWCIEEKAAVEKILEKIINERDVMELNRVAAAYSSMRQNMEDYQGWKEQNST